MMLNLQKVLLVVLLQTLIINCLTVENNLKPFDKEKIAIEQNINSMRLGNYLRRLMMRVILILFYLCLE